MKAKSFLEGRRLALEQAFLRRASPRLQQRLRGRRRRSREECLRACGMADRETLDALLRLGLTPESIAALALVPLVALAWTHGHVDPHEREAWLEGATKCGIDGDTPAHDLLLAWLAEPPDRDLFEAWARFSKGLCDHLPDEQRARLAEQLIERARAVARAAHHAGGGSAGSSAEEERELAKLAQAF